MWGRRILARDRQHGLQRRELRRHPCGHERGDERSRLERQRVQRAHLERSDVRVDVERRHWRRRADHGRRLRDDAPGG
jgi:hypothetical protein